MFYYIQDYDNNILLFDPSDKERLHNTIVNFMPQYREYEIQETETEIVSFEGKNYFVTDAEYIEKSAAKRKSEFLKEFFLVKGYGYYRRTPKGYSSAVESMNVLFNIALAMNGVQEGLMIFYTEPDFTDPSQCTEEWLVQNQILTPAMTKEEFMNLYSVFMTAWNTQEHQTIAE